MADKLDTVLRGGLRPFILLLPAYGRSYATEAEAKTEWKSGKDFRNDAFGYCSIRDVNGLTREFGDVYIKLKEGKCLVAKSNAI